MHSQALAASLVKPQTTTLTLAARQPWFAPVILAAMRWIDARLGPPHMADLQQFENAWDYRQADQQAWQAEPDSARLSEALRLWPTDTALAVTEMRALAARGSPLALNMLGESYYWGRGSPADRTEGERWFRLAFEAGSLRGLLNYGKVLYYRGDLDAAASVFGQGARQRWAPAIFWLGRTERRRGRRHMERRSRVTPLRVRAAAMGSPAAQVELGVLMLGGVYGMRRIRRGSRLIAEVFARMAAAKPQAPSQTASEEAVP